MITSVPEPFARDERPWADRAHPGDPGTWATVSGKTIYVRSHHGICYERIDVSEQAARETVRTYNENRSR